MDETPTIEPIPGSEPTLAQTLGAAGLPVDDLTEPGRTFFRFRRSDGALIGFIGWEQQGTTALLRSLVVLEAERGRGWSRVMTEWALQQLQAAGVREAYVLTTTIAELAQRLGFQRLAREQAPPVIRASRQFSALCPASAVLLYRQLG